MGREHRTLLLTLEYNLKPLSPSYEAIGERDVKTQTAYKQSFNKRLGVQALPGLQPGGAVCVKLEQRKGWKTPGKVIAEKTAHTKIKCHQTTHSILSGKGTLASDCRPIHVESYSEPKSDTLTKQDFRPESTAAAPDATQSVPLATQSLADLTSCPKGYGDPSRPEVRITSGQLLNKPIRFREDI